MVEPQDDYTISTKKMGAELFTTTTCIVCFCREAAVFCCSARAQHPDDLGVASARARAAGLCAAKAPPPPISLPLSFYYLLTGGVF